MTRHFLAYLLPSLLMGAFGFLVLVPVTTYYLDPRDFGIQAILTGLTLPIGPLSSTGVNWVLAGNYFKVPEQERQELLFHILLIDLLLKVFWIVAFWLLAPTLLPKLVGEWQPEFVGYFRLALGATLLTTLWPSVSYHLVLNQRSGTHALFELLPWLAGTAFTILGLAHFGGRTEILFWNPVIAGLLSFLLCLVYLRRHIRPSWNRRWVGEIIQVGLPTIPTNLVEMGKNVADRYLIQYWSTLANLGIYSHSQAYRNIFTMGTKAFSRALSPLALETFSKEADPTPLRKRLQQWYIAVGAAGILTGLFAPEAIALLTHGKFTAASSMVQVWFFLVLGFSYAIPYNNYLLAAKENSFLMRSDIASNVLFLALTVPAVYWFGAVGAVIASVGGSFALQAARHFFSRKRGCPSLGDSTLVLAAALVSVAIGLTHLFTPTLFQKTGIAVVLLACMITLPLATISPPSPSSDTKKETA